MSNAFGPAAQNSDVMADWPEGVAPSATKDDPWVVKPANKVFRTWAEADAWATAEIKAGRLGSCMIVPFRDEQRHAATMDTPQ